ncbi:CPBP family intramembrane glutamic endopeptidase [Alloiococcus sp. CFN-8]|uniref:CPBP family intramembrane glutamic endopeptidase n=1 Tax=Alloiococcus sp. CFN-8 TaxID=3416081 RepID=UPI003CE6CC48
MTSTFKGNLFALILILLQFFGSIYIVPILAAMVPSYICLLIFTQLLFLLAPVLFYFAVTGENFKEVLSLRILSFKNLCLVTLIALASQPVAWFLSYLSSLLFNNDVVDLFGSISIYPYWMLLIVLAVIPSFCEELAIRGVVLHGYKKEPVLSAAIITGLIFGMLHLNPQQLLYTSIIGVLFGYLVRITHSIFSAMIAHFVFNGFQVTISKLSFDRMEISRGMENFSVLGETTMLSTGIVMGVIAVIFGLIIVYLLRRLKLSSYGTNIEIVDGINEEDDIKEAPKDNPFNLPLIAIIFIFIGIMLFSYI